MTGRARCLGVVLAGGESRRMGRDKAAILFEGETLGARAVALLAGVADEVVVSGHGRGVDPSLPRLADDASGQGPLAGLLAASVALAERARRDPAWRDGCALLLPVDMPRMTPATLVALRDAPGAGAAALLTPTGHVAPLPMRVRAQDADAIAAALAAGQRSLLGLCARIGVQLVELAGAPSALDNLNSGELLPMQPPAPGQVAEVRVRRIGRQRDEEREESVAAEAPLQILLGPLPLAVLMRTPGHDEDLVRGFLLTERIVHSPDALAEVAPCTDVEAPEARGNVVRATLAEGIRVDPAGLQRSTFVGSSCGVCGKASVEQAMATAAPLPPGHSFSYRALRGLGDRLVGAQPLFAATGGSHGAALFDADGALGIVREDVGRHNAVDKVLGAAALAGSWPLGGNGLLVSGRISFEIVQKALAAGIDLVVGVSAPTSLAVALGNASGVAVAGFARRGRLTFYSGADRLVGEA